MMIRCGGSRRWICVLRGLDRRCTDGRRVHVVSHFGYSWLHRQLLLRLVLQTMHLFLFDGVANACSAVSSLIADHQIFSQPGAAD
eukprot:scaffold763_cov202-Alexandrium_tamarense.AAC.6